MDLTIITPVFNAEKFIEETVFSLLSIVDGTNIEYLIVDDGSTDTTLNILKGIEGNFTILEKSNGGEASAVNFGLSKATGDYIMIVNADDPLIGAPLLVEKSLNILKAHPEIVVVYPDWRMIDVTGKTLKHISTLDYKRSILINKAKCLPGPGAVFRGNFAKAVGGRSAKWRYVGDFDFWLRLSSFGDFYRIPEELASWRSHEGSLTTSGAGRLMAAENVEVMNEFIQNRNISNSDCREAVANANLNAALIGLTTNKIFVQKYLLGCIRNRPSSLFRIRLRTVFFLLFHPISFYLRGFLVKVNNWFQQSILRKE